VGEESGSNQQPEGEIVAVRKKKKTFATAGKTKKEVTPGLLFGVNKSLGKQGGGNGKKEMRPETEKKDSFGREVNLPAEREGVGRGEDVRRGGEKSFMQGCGAAGGGFGPPLQKKRGRKRSPL